MKYKIQATTDAFSGDIPEKAWTQTLSEHPTLESAYRRLLHLRAAQTRHLGKQFCDRHFRIVDENGRPYGNTNEEHENLLKIKYGEQFDEP